MGNAKTMLITQKKQYALRAVYELAKHRETGPIKSAQIAAAQAIPQRFLEIILNQLKHAGILTAKRGYTGGFKLNRAPGDITVEDIFKSLDDIDEAAVCVSCISKADCPFYGKCAFLPLWTQMQKAIDRICTATTIQSLLDDSSAPAEAEA
jgi:Rrf2 family protein